MYYRSIIKPSKPGKDLGEYQFHQEVWSLFPGEDRSKFIYRIGQDCIYIISEIQPIDTTGRWLVTSSTSYDPKVRPGLTLEFMTTVNPVYDRVVGNKKVRHSIFKDYFHRLKQKNIPPSSWPNGNEIKYAACKEWFETQKKKGFEVGDFSVTGYSDVQFKNNRTEDVMKFLRVDLRGILTVTDPEAFKQTLLKGIGKARRFGFGLLMVKAA